MSWPGADVPGRSAPGQRHSPNGRYNRTVVRARLAWFAIAWLTALVPVVSTAARTVAAAPPAHAPHRLDDSDRAAFRRWFTYLADAQFERPTDDVTDCAALVRHAYREALRAHTPEWFRRTRLPRPASFPDVRRVPPIVDGTWQLFRVAARPPRYGEFADAATLVRLNARRVSRDARQARPGDLLYFHQDGSPSPDHLMVVVGDSPFDGGRRDWLVYHTGPSGHDPGEVRKVALADLERHPAARWRPVAANPAFVGVFRLAILDAETVELARPVEE